ncbi:hypothetical protein P7F88_22340 [Vibrio hannami]|nr:hypothetical protein [Vibrio hannami]MDG3088651.1 hypothetical protein [Vibrio hannami]
MSNVRIAWLRKDPGLYECWNLGIKLTNTTYISNANVDDLRDCRHVTSLVSRLEQNENYSFAASGLYPFYEFSGDVINQSEGAPWYSDQVGDISYQSLGSVELKDNKPTLTPHNMPHCMPVWKRELHEKYGYFDELKYGTYADWAFWLKVTLNGELGYMSGEGLGYYYVNLESHNRRGTKLEELHKKIEFEFMPYFVAGCDNENHKLLTNIVDPKREVGEWVSGVHKKLNIHGVDLSYGDHRNSFNNLIDALLPLHTDKEAIIFLPFLERYFVWGDYPGEAASESPKPLERDWIGILHVPFDAPEWFHTNVSPETIFESELWKASLSKCRGLVTLSEDLARDINFKYPNLPTVAVKHPTEFDRVKEFDLSQFRLNPTIVQAGDWLRNLQAIHKIQPKGYRRVMLKKRFSDAYLSNEIEVFGDHQDENVEVYTMIPNDEYDVLLSQSIVICWLYATAANNLVLECIARKTPILINPLPSVVEYLGVDYPLYINDLSEVDELLSQDGIIEQTYNYLAGRDFSNELSYSSFYNSFKESDFYKNL